MCIFFKTENVASLAPKITRLSPDSWVISRNVTLSWNSSLTPSPSLFLDIMAYQVHVLFICSSAFDESGLFSNFLLALVVLALCSLCSIFAIKLLKIRILKHQETKTICWIMINFDIHVIQYLFGLCQNANLPKRC